MAAGDEIDLDSKRGKGSSDAGGTSLTKPGQLDLDSLTKEKHYELTLKPAADPADSEHRRTRERLVLYAAFAMIAVCLIVCVIIALCESTYSEDERKAAFGFITTAGTGLLGFIVGRSSSAVA